MKQMKRLQEQAARLERHVVTVRLLAYLAPHANEMRKSPGRFHLLGSIIQKHTPLLQALLENNTLRIHNEWVRVVQSRLSDVRFLHSLCIVYWESVIAKYETQEDTAQDWNLSTALWMTMLSAEEFWDYFAEDRWMTDQGQRTSLTAKQREDVLHTSLEEILTIHSTYGKQRFAARQYEQAKMHISCLDMCRNIEKKLPTLLKARGLPFALTLNPQAIEWIQTQANKILDDWCVALIGDAEKEATDADAIKQLPQGIRKNYAGAIRVLEPFIDLSIPFVRVLNACLEFYNDWTYDVYLLKDEDQQKKLVQSARKVTDLLIPLSTKGQSFSQENKLLSQHFIYRGLILEDPKQRLKEYQEALSWNNANLNAQQLIDQVSSSVYLDPVMEYVEKKEFTKAYQALEVAKKHVQDKKALQGAQAVVYFVHAQALLEEGELREALTRARVALQCDPSQEVIQNLVEALEEMAPEQENIRLRKRSEEALLQDRFDEAIRLASGIPSTSKVHKAARELLSIAYCNRGIQKANDGNLTQGETDLRNALRYADQPELSKKAKEQLSVLLTLRANVEAAGLQGSTSYQRTQIIARIKKLLEEALVLDPKNTNAHEALKVVKSVAY